MNSRTLLVVVVLAALAAVGAFFVLSGGDGGGDGEAAAQRRAAEAEGLPSFESDIAVRDSREQVAKPVEVPRSAVGDAGEGEVPAMSPRAKVPTRLLTGKVLRASDGTPIGGVALYAYQDQNEEGTAISDGHSISFHDENGEAIPSANSEADGSFRYAIPTTASNVTVQMPSNNARQDFPIPPGTEDLELELVFDSGFRVAGRVTDGSFAPIPQAEVEGGGSRTKTDADGRYLLRDVWVENQPVVKLKARAPMRSRATADVLVPRSPAEIMGADFKLLAAGSIAGQVSFSNGGPASGAVVEIVLRQSTDDVGEQMSDLRADANDQGLYAIEHVPPGRFLVQVTDRATFQPTLQPKVGEDGTFSLRLEILGGGGSDKDVGARQMPLGAWVQDVVVEEGRTTQLDLVLPAGAVLAGRVLDELNRPVADARVALQRRTTWPAPGMNGSSIMISDDLTVDAKGSGDGQGSTTMSRKLGEVHTDGEGRYAFSGLSGGAHHLNVSDPSGRLAPTSRDLVLRGDERLENVDFSLSPGLTLRLRIVDPAGRPLAGATVFITDADSHSITSKDMVGRSGEDGWFETHGLAVGKRRISVSLEGYSYFVDTFDPASPPSSITLKPAPKLHGLVLDGATNQPVPAFSLKIEYENSTMITDVQPHTDGRFTEDVGDDMTCRVTVTAPGYEPLSIEGIVPSATANRPVEFRLVKS